MNRRYSRSTNWTPFNYDSAIEDVPLENMNTGTHYWIKISIDKDIRKYWTIKNSDGRIVDSPDIMNKVGAFFSKILIQIRRQSLVENEYSFES